MEAISLRQSSRAFDAKELTEQQLSDIMWAAYGFNRADKRTVPSANDKQAYELYVVMAKGTYLYNAKDNVLELKDSKDLRAITGKQDFVKTAPVNIVFALAMSTAFLHIKRHRVEAQNTLSKTLIVSSHRR